MKFSIRLNQTEDGRYIATVPALPGCKSSGQTRDEATHKIEEAIRGYIAAVNDFVPENLQQEVVEV